MVIEDVEPSKSVELVKVLRPQILGGITVKVRTTCGNMYVQMNWKEGKLFEVFATLGHSGSCISCESEALTRSITLGLRCGVPHTEYAKELRGIRCPNPLPFPKETAVWSCPDAIGKVISEYGGLSPLDLVRLLRPRKEESAEVLGEELEAKRAMREMADERERSGLHD